MFGKRIFVLALLALVGSQALFARTTIGNGVSNAAREISERVPSGTRIAVLNISSDYVALSNFVINELILNIVRAGSFQVVPRSSVELEVAQREFDFQMDGLVSDDDQRSLGQFLGVDTFVTGFGYQRNCEYLPLNHKRHSLGKFYVSSRLRNVGSNRPTIKDADCRW